MSKTPLQLAGKRSGKLVAIKPVQQNSLNQWKWLCVCDCGKETVVLGSRINKQCVGSCGCLKKRNKVTHGRSKTPEYRAYSYAKTRCGNKKQASYKHYGGRGIQFKFTSFEQFFAELGSKPSPLHSLDRINNDGHYEPGNCRWATAHEQGMNKRFRRGTGAKLTDDLVLEIREKYRVGGVSCQKLAKLYNIGATAIHKIVTTKSYRKLARKPV